MKSDHMRKKYQNINIYAFEPLNIWMFIHSHVILMRKWKPNLSSFCHCSYIYTTNSAAFRSRIVIDWVFVCWFDVILNKCRNERIWDCWMSQELNKLQSSLVLRSSWELKVVFSSLLVPHITQWPCFYKKMIILNVRLIPYHFTFLHISILNISFIY